MENAIRSLQQEIIDFEINTPEDLETFRLKYTVRKGLIAALFGQLKSVDPAEKPRIGQLLNELKQSADAKLSEVEEQTAATASDSNKGIDLTLPGRRYFTGSEHPVQKVLGEMKKIFSDMGFGIATGPELELDHYNFDMLNFPPDHPARDMQDTFFITNNGNAEPDVLLRTHTSPVQVRVMLDQKPPIRVICPGKVYRNEAISSRSYCVFHQLEGLYIDKNVSFADLKATIYSFARQMFGTDVKLRFRPSFFPFTEPSAEVDVTCYLCGGKGCRVCKKSGWLEIMGCGMVHPNVMRNCGIDPETWSGYAFGMGVDRTVLLRYKIDDIRLLFENDLRMLRQFTT